MALRFHDRAEAGQLLAAKLSDYANRPDVLVLALPRGGVPVGYEVAKALTAPFDVFLVRKLGVPGHEELAMGASASGGVQVLNDDVVSALNIPPRAIDEVAGREAQELERRMSSYSNFAVSLQAAVMEALVRIQARKTVRLEELDSLKRMMLTTNNGQ